MNCTFPVAPNAMHPAVEADHAIRLGERFAAAVEYANQAHAEQVRKDGRIPFISHPLAVAALVLEYGGDEDQAIAAVLHDTVEDCGVHCEQEIRERFGEEVVRIVLACSETNENPKPDWAPRKRAYIARMAHEDPRTLLVSACDKAHNLRCMLWDHRRVGAAMFDRFSATVDDTFWFYRELAAVYQARGCPASREVAHLLQRLHEEHARIGEGR